MMKNSDMLPWNYAADFFDIIQMYDDEYAFDITEIEVSYGDMYYNSPWDMVVLNSPCAGYPKDIIEGFRQTFGVILKHRPDLSEYTFEVVGSV